MMYSMLLVTPIFKWVKFRYFCPMFIVIVIRGTDRIPDNTHFINFKLVPSKRCTIKINLLGLSKLLYHCFLKSVRLFTIPNLSYLFGMISEFRLGQGAIFNDARLLELQLL